MTVLFANPTEVWLEIPPAVQTASWQQSQSAPTNRDRWNSYLNRISLDVILPWLQQEYAPEAIPCSGTTANSTIWELVGGSAILVGNLKLILIPTETIDTDEFRVPQEWADIPEWVGDYYLAVRVDPDEGYVNIWGYATHRQLKTRGSYDGGDRTYALDGDDVVRDLAVLWVSREFCPRAERRVAVAALPVVPTPQAENLLRRLGNPDLTVPRLEVPFPLWGSLLADETWRDGLFRCRRGRTEVNLSRWFDNWFETGWQAVETVFPTSGNLGFAFRRSANLRDPQTGRVPRDEPIRRVKLIQVGEDQRTVALLVELSPESDGRVGMRIQLLPGPEMSHLPAKIRLSLISETGETLKSIEARDRDDLLQIPRFKCSSGYHFSLRVQLDEIDAIEMFGV
ncbi:MAG: DUF1822 family protein [Limnospira sp.]